MKLLRLLVFFSLLTDPIQGQIVRTWASYYGGSDVDDILGVTTDAYNNVYFAGRTHSSSGIAWNGSQLVFGGATDAFIAKMDAAGNLVWSTYFGGGFDDEAYDIAVDDSGNVYVAGTTKDTTGAISFNGFQSSYGGGVLDAFLAKYDSNGALIWSTYFGSTGLESAWLGIDPTGGVYLTGQTSSATGISYNGFQNSFGGGWIDAYLVKFDAAGNRIWSTYIGGFGDDYAYDVCCDQYGNPYLTGYTNSTDSIAINGYQNSISGVLDAYLIKFDSSGNRLWGTYYGGSDAEVGFGVATNKFGNGIYIAGQTFSSNGISLSGYQNYFGGAADAYLARFDSTGNLIWATYYGGPDYEEVALVSVDSSGKVFLAFDTYSDSGLNPNGFQLTPTQENQFLVSFSPQGNRLCATYYGQIHDENARLSVDADDNVYLTGNTAATTGIAFNGFQNSFGGLSDGYIVKFEQCDISMEIENADAGSHNIFPNPSHDIFYFHSEGSCTATVYDVFGRVVLTFEQHGGENFLDLHDYADGTYYLQVADDIGGVTTIPLVKISN